MPGANRARERTPQARPSAGVVEPAARRKFWGWGLEGEGLAMSELEQLGATFAARFGIEGVRVQEPPRVDELELQPSRVCAARVDRDGLQRGSIRASSPYVWQVVPRSGARGHVSKRASSQRRRRCAQPALVASCLRSARVGGRPRRFSSSSAGSYAPVRSGRPRRSGRPLLPIYLPRAQPVVVVLFTTGTLPPKSDVGTHRADTARLLSCVAPWAWPNWTTHPSNRFGSGVFVLQSMRPGNDAATATWLVLAVMSVLLSVSCTPPLMATYFCELVALLGSQAAVDRAVPGSGRWRLRLPVLPSRDEQIVPRRARDVPSRHGRAPEVRRASLTRRSAQ